MSNLILIALGILLPATISVASHQSYEYCIVGAGPAGLQLAHFMQSSGARYAVLERAPIAGSFFATYPRHGKLISINKRWTDSANTEYSLRHDWNSLINVDRDPRLLFRQYSREIFPPREAMVDYLNDFRVATNLTVHFNTSVAAVTKSPVSGTFFLSTTGVSNGVYECQVVIMATGFPNLRPANFTGHEWTVGYDRVSVNRSDFEGKRLLIIGKGNSGFETAQHVYGQTKLIHLVGRSPVRFAWSTHYVGDLRAVNNEVLDTYQLKSLDGAFEFDSIKLEKSANGDLCLVFEDGELEAEGDGLFGAASDAKQRLNCYDMVVRATGFGWDSGPTAALNVASTHGGKYPKVGDNFESADTPGLYFAGTVTHSLDFRRSAGGFVHGFRYTARALHRMLRVRRHGERWPSTDGPASGLLDALLKRINEGSGTYQMFEFLGDVVLLDQHKSKFTLLEEVPIRLLHELSQITGHPAPGPVIVFLFEYGRHFSGPRADTFREDRASCFISNAHECNFLHPVVYQYDRLPVGGHEHTEEFTLPRPDRLLHLTEDFYTNFRQAHQVVPLAAFLEGILDRPAAAPSVEHCTLRALLIGQWPSYCPDTGTSGAEVEVLGIWSR